MGLSNRQMHGLFVYGTLHPDLAPEAVREHVAKLKPLGPATIHARLLTLGDYPGLVFTGTLTPIQGELFALPNDTETLSALDAYEGYSQQDPTHSLFVRELHTLTLPNGTTEQHWLYRYNQPE